MSSVFVGTFCDYAQMKIVTNDISCWKKRNMVSLLRITN